MTDTKNGHNLKNNFSHQSENGNSGTNWTRNKTPNVTHHYFGVERDGRILRRFRLFFRDGKVISIPYAYLPLIVYEPDHAIYIKTGELEIVIKGRALNLLAEELNMERIQWIKESESGTDDFEAPVFVESIRMNGDMAG
jgi:hypothetical protein